jgi:hypothetical protein
MIEIYTPELRQQYADFLRTHRIVHGIGDKDAACTIAALNVAATGRVTDARPDCMSAVIHAWIIIIQDRMPLALLNSEAWIAAAIDAPGSGNDHDAERLAIIMDWMWDSLSLAQAAADAHGHGDTWRAMCELRTSDSAAGAARAAGAAGAVRAARAAGAAGAVRAARAAGAAGAAGAVRAARAAHAAGAADAAGAAADAADADVWEKLDPCGLLDRLNAVSA